MIFPAALRYRPTRRLRRTAAQSDGALLAALFEDSASGILLLDGDRRITRVNRTLHAMFPRHGALLIPDAPAEALFVPEDREQIAAALATALQGGEFPPLQVRLHAGEPAAASVVAVSASALHEPAGAISGLIVRLTDVSATLRLHAQVAELQKLQSVGQLAAGIAHDFNNLLAAIGAAAEAVSERETRAPATLDDARQIRQSVDRGAALVRQLLAFGRRQPLQPAVIAVNQALRNLSDMLRRLLGAHVRLELALEEPGRCVRADPSQFDQVLVNLAINARDAMPTGGTLTVRTGHLTLYHARRRGTETMPAGRYVSVEVADTGEGIPPTILPRIFEPFFTTRRAGGGSGLGLSTVYGIIHQSSGFITADSTVGRGTCIRFWLPRHEAVSVVAAAPRGTDGPKPAPPGSASSALDSGLPQRRALLVEDEEPVRRLTERALRRAGWQVLCAESGEAALAALAGGERSEVAPRIVVSDMMLPGMNGVELVRAVRAIWPDLPAVLVSGYTDSALLGDLGAQEVAFLSKPFHLKDLVARMDDAVRAASVRN